MRLDICDEMRYMQELHAALTGEQCCDKYGGTATGFYEKTFPTHAEEC